MILRGQKTKLTSFYVSSLVEIVMLRRTRNRKVGVLIVIDLRLKSPVLMESKRE